MKIGQSELTEEVIKALHTHAVACLDAPAWNYRDVQVTAGELRPPLPEQVPVEMETFVETVNRCKSWMDPFNLAAYCLWQLISVHPFTNGNGRTARALAYYVFCVALGGEGAAEGAHLPRLLKANRKRYIELLRKCDELQSQRPLRDYLVDLLVEHRKAN